MVEKMMRGAGAGAVLLIGVVASSWLFNTVWHHALNTQGQARDQATQSERIGTEVAPTQTDRLSIKELPVTSNVVDSNAIKSPAARSHAVKQTYPSTTAYPQPVTSQLSSQTNQPTSVSALTEVINTTITITPTTNLAPTLTSVVQATSPTAIPSSPVELPLEMSVVTQGAVEKHGDIYHFNQMGAASMGSNHLTINLIDTMMDTPWLNFRLRIISSETLAGFDDPCFMVMQNGTPIFAIGHVAYSHLNNDGWLDVSLKMSEALILAEVESASEAINQLTVMAGENGDVLGHTSIQVQLLGFSKLPRFGYLQAIQPTQFSVVGHAGYVESAEALTDQPYFLTLQSALTETYFNAPSIDASNSLRWYENVYWFRDDLLGYGYELIETEKNSVLRLVLPLELTQQITVLPKQY